MPKIAREVLDYFLRNPRVADSLEGVARWRLHDEPVHRSVEEISQALERLVAEGFLAAESGTGSGQIFRLNGKKAAEARTLLDGR